MNLRSTSVLQTKRFARQIANMILRAEHRAHAAVVALSGDFGAGKTTFAQGFARALGVKQRIVSPTFILFRRYALSAQRFAFLYHVDAYRPHNPKELVVLGFKKIFADHKNIVLVEWPENVRKLLPRDTIMIRMEHGGKASERMLTVVAKFR